MKILSRMMTRKPQPEEALESLDLDKELEPLRRREQAAADDSGAPNPSSAATEAEDAPFAVRSRPIRPKSSPAAEASADDGEPEVVGKGWETPDWDDDDWDDDDDWGEEDLEADDPARTLKASQDKAHLVSEIREAMGSVNHIQPDAPSAPSTPASAHGRNWADDPEFGRRAIARSQLTSSAAEDRILEKTETAMTDHETSRRRSAMAHLKAAAAATKADRVLSHVVSRDPASDPEEQSPYRDDLAKVVRPHRPTSRPISRQVVQSEMPQAVWDQGTGDEDAAMFAASTDDFGADPSVEAELDAAEAERLARTPLELSEEDFADDSVFGGAGADEDDDDFGASFPNSPFGGAKASTAGAAPNAFDPDAEFDDDDLDDDDDFSPTPSSAVSEAVAYANGADDEIDEPEEGEVRRKIWEMADEVATQIESVRPTEGGSRPIVNVAPVNVAPVVPGRAGRSAGRVKTRMLGFQPEGNAPKDVFEETAEKVSRSEAVHFPAGWIVVVSGPGRGASFTLHNGVSQIGRGEDQAVRLDFGDTSISRNNHAAVAYDDEQGKFYLGHGGKSNLVRLNGRPVLSTEEMSNGDTIRIGETTLKFIALCGEDFTWKSTEGSDSTNA